MLNRSVCRLGVCCYGVFQIKRNGCDRGSGKSNTPDGMKALGRKRRR